MEIESNESQSRIEWNIWLIPKSNSKSTVHFGKTNYRKNTLKTFKNKLLKKNTCGNQHKQSLNVTSHDFVRFYFWMIFFSAAIGCFFVFWKLDFWQKRRCNESNATKKEWMVMKWKWSDQAEHSNSGIRHDGNIGFFCWWSNRQTYRE